jgi:predicted HicB family RNase H-like nuclease
VEKRDWPRLLWAAVAGASNAMTSRINESCTYTAGPYKGYVGRAEYDRQSQLFHGDVIGTKDVITFQAKTIRKLRRAFCDSVDEYLRYCKQRGERPEKPFSGKFVARISPEVHRRISLLAERSGKSLNAVVEECLSQMAGPAATPGDSASSVTRRARKTSGKGRATLGR